ncbi:single-stranded DNA-binding replication protein A, large (70 kD) subunit [Cenarchaeum symbiosum A]|uniref:Single-stranded DNA-binding replication protein A, large (70 kD) subunit n=1 Tax=Cenarchaeum symbiosum (strain A) TaxID=414004 RepID=A0RYZ5_CENSY|nr:single-stranded DNA-binding replication protein A, large (70 kD) subunit [Cenarchaeum symbiosum A]
MSDFEELMGKLMELKPDLDRAAIENLIREKKERIGAGYLTDQGALFLVAGELNVKLDAPARSDVVIKDLRAGAKDVSLEARMLNMSQTKEYSRKDGTPFKLRTMTVYDGDESGTKTASVKLWDDKANLEGIDSLGPGDLVKILRAYVRADRDGTPTINIGSDSGLEKSGNTSSIPGIEKITRDISTVSEGEKDLAVSGTIDGQIGTIRFTNSRGEPGTALRFRMKGSGSSPVKVVVWGKDEKNLPAVISQDSKTVLLGVRAKMAEQGLEVHGNESTLIKVEGSDEITPVTARILSVRKSPSGSTLILGVNEKKNLLQISDTGGQTDELAAGDIMECMPSKVHGNSITLDSGSYARKMSDSDSLPKRGDLRTKIKDVADGGNYCIEAVVLNAPEKRDILTRAGDTVELGEMLVGDDTGEIPLKGWRDQARMIEGLKAGQKFSAANLNARAGLEGRIELVLVAYSDMEPA